MGKYYSNQQILQDYGILFENIKTQTELASELAEYGYDDTEIAKGKALYDKALEEYQKNIKESQEETSSYAVFSQKMEKLTEVYATDRKKVRIIYKDQDDVLKNLRLKGKSSRVLANILDDIRILYVTLKEKSELLTPVKRLKIDETHLESQLEKLQEAEKAYSIYIKEKGESQQATKNKNKALSDLEKWVREFYAIAKIALEDKPQLLESLGKSVR
ncbi:hypothetical protein [Capnocytophaga sp.]|uniref:hypothetical protein n=1 Tax=Capnocytophaga sp. TaxID=44737 RepID=UPI0026DB402D|nr:hypothetical protein [Capnocytophaga sp.]MDO5106625.1 hypothetical protein [Capnocytophaga sp.]